MSEWRYDETSGSFRRSDEYGNGGYNRYNGKKGSGSGGWLLIGVMFALGLWPIALFLLIAKLTETPSAPKRTETYAAQSAQTAQTAQKSGKSGKSAASGKVAQAAKSVTQTPDDTSKTAKTLQIVGAVVAALGAILALGEVGAIFDATMAVDWSFLLQSLAIAAGGGAMLLSGRKMSRRRARIARYQAVLGTRDFVTVEELMAVTGRKRDKVMSDINYMVQKNLLGTGAFLDEGRGILFKSADAYQRFLQERTKRENLTPKEANEGYSGALRAIREANDRIPDPIFSEKLDRMEELAGKIFREVEAHPEKQKQASTFFDYYLPTTLKLLGTYTEFEAAGIEGENLRQAKSRIESIMDTLLENFEKQLDELYRSEAMDVDADIRVMESMLERDLSSVERDFGLSGGAATQTKPR